MSARRRRRGSRHTGVRGAASLLAVLVLAAGCGAAPTRPELIEIGAGLRGPSGLRATVYASGLRHAAAFAFDRRGRLWVATAGLRSHAGHGIYLVPRAGARPVRVVSGLRTPLGLAWVGERLYVASLGRVDAYGGLRGTHFTSRTTIVDGPLRNGQNDNLVLAPNGRLVMAVSAPCDHCVPASRWAAAIVSFRLDGSDLRVYASRIRAGFGLAFYPGTSDLFVTMNQRDDLGDDTPGDWLAAVHRGDDWDFPACYGQGGSACDGVPAPTAVLDPHAAAGGVSIVTGQLGEEVGTAALVAEWQLGKVQLVSLERAGSTYRGSAAPFLAGLENPLPIVVTAHGVLVGDWGTGTIYRVGLT